MQGAVDVPETGTHEADDVLDRETVDRIEELHAAVARAEAEQRFGVLRKRSGQAEAEAAEREFLHGRGFASYTDYRLRIRRSRVGGRYDPSVTPAPVVSREHGPVAPGPVVRNEPEQDRGAPASRGVEWALAAGAPTQCAELARAYDQFFVRLRAEADRLVELRLQHAEREAADVRDSAAREAAELMRHAREVGGAVRSLIGDLANLSEVSLRAMETVKLLDE
jgi:hypothetical protein